MFDSRNIFFNKRFLIYGLGKSGISSFYFLKNDNNINVFDDNSKLSINKIIKKSLIKLSQIKKKNFDFIVVSPGIDIKKCKLKNYLKKNFERIITDLDIFFYKHNKNKNITITGTNGKSTSAKLMFDIIKNHKKDVRLTGNIGNPILFEKNVKLKTIFIVEASSYQIEYSKFFKANYAAILNITPDHLERHGSFNNYMSSINRLGGQNKCPVLSNNRKIGDYLEKYVKKDD